jgi:hypothetical protein
VAAGASAGSSGATATAAGIDFTNQFSAALNRQDLITCKFKFVNTAFYGFIIL